MVDDEIPVYKRTKKKPKIKPTIKKKPSPKVKKKANSKAPTKTAKRKQKDPNILKRTLCNWERFDMKQMNILRFMCRESKNIYNTSIFHIQIYNRYSNQIFAKLYSLVEAGVITNSKKFYEKLCEFYDNFYDHYLKIKSQLFHNNNVIFKFIKRLDRKMELCVVNMNFQSLFKGIVYRLCNENRLHYPKNATDSIKKELCDDIVMNILKSMYNRNFYLTEMEVKKYEDLAEKKIEYKEVYTIDDDVFVRQVKKNQYLFKKKPTNYVALIKKHKSFVKGSVKTHQNYISRMIMRHYKPKIPSDLMGNIITKAYRAFSSFFALRQKGYKGNAPKFLPYNSLFVLPFFARSRKEVTINNKKYYRLTVGST